MNCNNYFAKPSDIKTFPLSSIAYSRMVQQQLKKIICETENPSIPTSNNFPALLSSMTSRCNPSISCCSLFNMFAAGVGQSLEKAKDSRNCPRNCICLLLKADTCFRTEEASLAMGVEICWRHCSASFFVCCQRPGRLYIEIRMYL